jgi:excinuclease UvrABC nuclease subunit
VADKFLNDSLDLFKMRRCTFDLNPDPIFPGCVYSEMKMCLAPCFKGCTDQEYKAVVARVQEFFDSGGESLLLELEAERERLSAALDFEGAAGQHAKIVKLKGILSACDDICGRLDRLNAVILQPSAEARSVALFHFHGGELLGPVSLAMGAEEETPPVQASAIPAEIVAAPAAPAQSMESRIHSALESLNTESGHATQRFIEELAILKRWYYRTHKAGEMFFADGQGELPWRRIVRGATRVYRGEKESPIPSQIDDRQRSEIQDSTP